MEILKNAIPKIIIFTVIIFSSVALNYYLTKPIDIYEFNQLIIDNDTQKIQEVITTQKQIYKYRFNQRLNRPAKPDEIKNAETDPVAIMEVIMERLDALETKVATLEKVKNVV